MPFEWPFESPDVYSPPGSGGVIPRPSIYSDERGEIHNYCAGGKNVNILYTRAGVMRSGDLHKNTQKDFLFSGKCKVWLKDTDTGKDTFHIMEKDQFLAIPPGTPHIFEFLEDSVMAEWWEPGAFEAFFYRPYRKLVDASFKPKNPGENHFTVLGEVSQSDGRLSGHSSFIKGAILGAVVTAVVASALLRK